MYTGDEANDWEVAMEEMDDAAQEQIVEGDPFGGPRCKCDEREVPNIEDGGCDVCDDPKCYRNQPIVQPTPEELAELDAMEQLAAEGLRAVFTSRMGESELLAYLRDQEEWEQSPEGRKYLKDDAGTQ